MTTVFTFFGSSKSKRNGNALLARALAMSATEMPV